MDDVTDAETARENARDLKNAVEVLEDWREYLVDEQDSAEVTAAMEAVKEAEQKMGDMYKELMMHASVLTYMERGEDSEEDGGDSGRAFM